MIDCCPSPDFAPHNFVIGFGYRGLDEHGAGLGHIALLGQQVGIIAVSGLDVGIELHGPLVPFCRFRKIILAVVGVCRKKGRRIVGWFQFQGLRILFQRFVEIALRESGFACKHDLFHRGIIRKLDHAIGGQLR